MQGDYFLEEGDSCNALALQTQLNASNDYHAVLYKKFVSILSNKGIV